MIVWLLLVVLATQGCAAILAPALILDAVATGVSVYQRREDRLAENAQTDEIKALREEIARLRNQMAK